MRAREGTIQVIEDLGKTLREQGKVQRWLEEIKDQKVRRISEGVNGPLLDLLAVRARYHDKRVIELFREGAPIVGILPRAGLGKPVPPVIETTLAQLNRRRESKNKALISSITEDKHSKALLNACKEDAKKGRMEPVHLVQNCDLNTIVLSPRFSVEQGKPISFHFNASLLLGVGQIASGIKEDGSMKIRPIDDMSRYKAFCSQIIVLRNCVAFACFPGQIATPPPRQPRSWNMKVSTCFCKLSRRLRKGLAQTSHFGRQELHSQNLL